MHGISALYGIEPIIETFADTIERSPQSDRFADGVPPAEIGVFAGTDSELMRARNAGKAAGAASAEVDRQDRADHRSRFDRHKCTVAKGLECRAVAVTACDDEVIPLQERIEGAADEADLEEPTAPAAPAPCRLPSPHPSTGDRRRSGIIQVAGSSEKTYRSKLRGLFDGLDSANENVDPVLHGDSDRDAGFGKAGE
jgi:hypothetical protein